MNANVPLCDYIKHYSIKMFDKNIRSLLTGCRIMDCSLNGKQKEFKETYECYSVTLYHVYCPAVVDKKQAMFFVCLFVCLFCFVLFCFLFRFLFFVFLFLFLFFVLFCLFVCLLGCLFVCLFVCFMTPFHEIKLIFIHLYFDIIVLRIHYPFT